MAIKAKLTGLGTAPFLANVQTGTLTGSLTATGSAQTDALAITDDISWFTTVASSTGAKLRGDLTAGDTQTVVNYGAQTLSVYPPGTGKIQNGSSAAAFSVAANKVAVFICLDGGTTANFAAVLSA